MEAMNVERKEYTLDECFGYMKGCMDSSTASKKAAKCLKMKWEDCGENYPTLQNAINKAAKEYDLAITTSAQKIGKNIYYILRCEKKLESGENIMLATKAFLASNSGRLGEKISSFIDHILFEVKMPLEVKESVMTTSEGGELTDFGTFEYHCPTCVE